MGRRLQQGVRVLRERFADELNAQGSDAAPQKQIETLDPTQHEVYNTVSQWSAQKLEWIEGQALTAQPSVRFPVLGTTGTG